RRLLPTRSRSNSNELPLEEPLAHTGPGRRVTSPVRALSSADPGMSVTVRDARVLAADRRWIEGVCRDYLDDLAPLNTGIFPALGEIGHREPDQLARWFADPGAKILTVCKSAAPVGFAMVVPGRRLPGRPPVDFHMAEFFIARE